MIKKALLLTAVLAFPVYHANAEDTQLTKRQETVLAAAKRVAKGHPNFKKVLPAIALHESNLGENPIGDSSKTMYIYPVNGAWEQVPKSRTFESGSEIRAKVEGKTVKVQEVKIQKSLERSSLGPFHIKVDTAIRVINDMKLSEHQYLLKPENSQVLVKKLLSDEKFGAQIAANYLELNRKIAERRGYRNPVKYAISKYNGGSNNVAYVAEINRRIKELEN